MVKNTCCGRLPADPHPDHPGVPVRLAVVRGVGPAGAQQAPDGGQAGALRVRDRARHRPPDPVPGAVLPGGDDLHHLRHRGGLPLPVGRHLPAVPRVRAGRGPGLRRRRLHLLRLPGRQRRAQLGPVQAPGRRHAVADLGLDHRPHRHARRGRPPGPTAPSTARPAPAAPPERGGAGPWDSRTSSTTS